MSPRSWTPEQREAITLPESLLVSAAAGAGKTAVLTERIVRLVDEGGDMNRMLVVTFTEAATREMRQRIETRLLDAARRADTPEKAARFREQAQIAGGRGGGSGSVSTIHGFCLYLLRRNFHRLGLDPAFSIADDVQQKMLFAKALEDVAASRCETTDIPYLNLLHSLGKEEYLFDHGRTLHTFLMSEPEPWKWLAAAQADYRLDEEGLKRHPMLNAWVTHLRHEVEGILQELSRVRRMVPRELVTVLGLFDDVLLQLRGVLLQREYPAMAASLTAVRLGTFKGWPKEQEPENKERVHGFYKKLRARLKKLAANLPSLSEAAALQNSMIPLVDALCAFVKDVDAAYAARKTARSLVDFSDMEHMALQILKDDGICQKLRERFDYIFVDEYQDSSRIQEAILGRISRDGGNLFLVGDIKQSIYRFRQADPGLFLQKLKTYSGEPGAPGRQVHLNKNFRSAPGVLAFINALFSRIMSPEVGEITYDETAALYPAPQAEDTALTGCELLLIEKNSEEQEGEDLSDVEAEALLAAVRIRELLETGEYAPHGKAPRPLRCGDFAVLLRAHRKAAEVWAKTLAEQGIPAYAQLTGGYFEAVEVQVFLNLLRVIDNRRQDIPMWSVLRGVFGFSQEDLIALRANAPEAETCYDCLNLMSATDTPLGRRAAALLFRLINYRRDARLLPLPEFIAGLMDDTGYYACVGALPGGGQRQANLDALLGRARTMSGQKDLSGFLHFMDLAASNADLGRAQPGAADVVRILSMHSAKGLEYPVVILGGLGKLFNTETKKNDLLLEGDLGLGIRLARPDTRIKLTPLLYSAIREARWRQQLSEEMRILYVGMTRARERLIMIGAKKNAEGACAEAAQIEEFTPSMAASAKGYLEWLLPVAVQTDAVSVCVHGRKPPVPFAEEGEEIRAAEFSGLMEKLKAKLDWRYPHQQAAFIPSKVSVSGLGAGGPQAELTPAPAFLREEAALTAAQRGTAAHQFLSAINIHAYPTENVRGWLQDEVSRLRAEGKLSEAEARAVSLHQIGRFLASRLGQRMRLAKRLERELEFCLEIAADQLMDEQTAEPVLLQGVIDCCFLEENNWILIDYKTDYIASDAELQEKAAHHGGQVRLYAHALSTLTGIPVDERYVVFLRAGACVPV